MSGHSVLHQPGRSMNLRCCRLCSIQINLANKCPVLGTCFFPFCICFLLGCQFQKVPDRPLQTKISGLSLNIAKLHSSSPQSLTLKKRYLLDVWYSFYTLDSLVGYFYTGLLVGKIKPVAESTPQCEDVHFFTKHLSRPRYLRCLYHFLCLVSGTHFYRLRCFTRGPSHHLAYNFTCAPYLQLEQPYTPID